MRTKGGPNNLSSCIYNYGEPHSIYAYVGGNPVSKIDPQGLAAMGKAIGSAIGGWSAGILTSETGPGAIAAAAIGRAVGGVIGSVIKDAVCKPDDPPCTPPEGTQCYEGPDTTHSHAGLNPHYHIFQMFKFGGKCQWKYLGGKVGKGVLAMPPLGMSACSTYPGFQGR